MKIKLLTIILALVMCACLLTSSVLAWFVISDQINYVEMQLAKIDSLVTIYKGYDYNYNGILNYGWYSGEDTSTVPSHPLYEELGQSAAVGAESVNIGLLMQIEDMLPTQLHTFKLHVLNNSDARNTVRMAFENYDVNSYLDENNGNAPFYDGNDFDEFIALLKVLSVTVYKLNNDGINIDETYDKVYLAHMTFTSDGDNRNSSLNIVSDLWVDSALQITNDNDVELLFVFEFEPLEDLIAPVASGGAGLTMTQAEYEANQNAFFMLPLLRIYLEIPD